MTSILRLLAGARGAQVQWAKMKSPAGAATCSGGQDLPYRRRRCWICPAQGPARRSEPLAMDHGIICGDSLSLATWQRWCEHRLRGDSPRSFQQAVAACKCLVVFVKAGCGSGKTLAAYLWAGANYPRGGSISATPPPARRPRASGTICMCPKPKFSRTKMIPSAQQVRELGARLFHSRRDIDFEIILSTGNDAQQADADSRARLESLEAWATPVVACTVDTVLGLVQNGRRGLYAWPALSQSAFVFDEIHAYDDRLFGALLRFLRDVPGLPVLLMTASLPARREEALRNLLESRGQSWEPISGPVDLETRPRYRKSSYCRQRSFAHRPRDAVRWRQGVVGMQYGRSGHGCRAARR